MGKLEVSLQVPGDLLMLAPFPAVVGSEGKYPRREGIQERHGNNDSQLNGLHQNLVL